MMSLQNRNSIFKLGLAALAVAGLVASQRAQAGVTQGQISQSQVTQRAISVAAGAKNDKVVKTEDEWRKILTPDQFHVLREAGTEYAGTGELLDEHRKGTFICAGCGQALFSSATKFESGTGWPSFFQPLRGGVEEHMDPDGSGRVEVECSRCNGHLGHVFNDGPRPTGLRYCMNSVAMGFVKAK